MTNLRIIQTRPNANILHESMGPMPDSSMLLKRLQEFPPVPIYKSEIPAEFRIYELDVLDQLRVPSVPILELARTLDVAMSTGYSRRNPDDSSVWGRLCSGVYGALAEEPAPVVFLSGVSGTGKTKGLQGTLEYYPQSYLHKKFPGCVGSLRQINWLYVQMPGSGSLQGLLTVLVNATANALEAPDLISLFKPRNAADVENCFKRWTRFVQGHYLGVLVIDEVQNLFKLSTVKSRRKNAGREDAELRLADDKTLKELMNFIDSSGIPLILSGTPDAEVVLKKRFAVSQRLTTGGRIEFGYSKTPDCPDFVNLLNHVSKYQWGNKHLTITDSVRDLIHSYTAGIRRLVIALWKASQKIALLSGEKGLTEMHIRVAAMGPLADVRAAVAALLSGDPNCIRQFEDLCAGF